MSITRAEFLAFQFKTNAAREAIEDFAVSSPDATIAWVETGNGMYLVFQIPPDVLEKIDVYDPNYYAMEHGHEMVCEDGIHRAAVRLTPTTPK